MKFRLIKTQEEFDTFLDDIYPENAYCANNNWDLGEAMEELGISFPIVLEDRGICNLGRGYYILTKNDIDGLKKIVEYLESA